MQSTLLGVIGSAYMTVDRSNTGLILAAILATTFCTTALTYYLAARAPHLSRGKACEGATKYPTEVNLRFDKIRINDALQLLAGFSCNTFKTNDLSERYIKADFSNAPWDKVVAKICHDNSLACWTEADTLYGAKRETAVQQVTRLVKFVAQKL